jgi:hypothetical protein
MMVYKAHASAGDIDVELREFGCDMTLPPGLNWLS